MGKTSIFRIISGLWKPKTGFVEMNAKSIFFISQRPYLVPNGHIRQQLCYPNHCDRFEESAIVKMLKFVSLYDLIAKRGGLDCPSVIHGLSGGERQRIGMARCLLHRPVFALLDECSSAVSQDMTDRFFEQCIEDNITLVTIAHDLELRHYHKQVLQISKGEWNIIRN